MTDTINHAPLRMIDTETGQLCDAARLRIVFQNDKVFGNLIASRLGDMSTPHQDDINHDVENFFHYVMFSHRWQGKEPLYGDVKNQSVYEYDPPKDQKDTTAKLRAFCSTAKAAGYRWAWSDTCCINQTDPHELHKSIISMFKWYHKSSLTLVYLWDVQPSKEPGGLEQSKWFTRGWTLQELLAPPIIRFFHNDWTPYLFDPLLNHKESEGIMREITSAVGVHTNDLLSFHPSSDDVRWKLHMASKRDTTEPEDVAYCLFGIFDVDTYVRHGEGPHRAVGRLLQQIIACSKSRDVGCLAWVGESSKLNTCLPTHVEAYQGSSHTPASIREEEIRRSVSELVSSFTEQQQSQALALYYKLAYLRRAEFSQWQLRLPCITFCVTSFKVDQASEANTSVYTAKATALEETRICTVTTPPSSGLLLVCPWIHELLDLDNVRYHRSRSSPSSHRSPSPSSSAPFDERTRALNFVARLKQPMTALLLSKRYDVYKRVATDCEIVIQLCREVRLDDLTVEVVDIE